MNKEKRNSDIFKISEEDILGPPRLTVYELARIIGVRATQIAYGAPILIPISRKKGKKIKEEEIAKMELKAGVLPITVIRCVGNNCKSIPIYKLKIEENV